MMVSALKNTTHSICVFFDNVILYNYPVVFWIYATFVIISGIHPNTHPELISIKEGDEPNVMLKLHP